MLSPSSLVHLVPQRGSEPTTICFWLLISEEHPWIPPHCLQVGDSQPHSLPGYRSQSADVEKLRVVGGWLKDLAGER